MFAVLYKSILDQLYDGLYVLSRERKILYFSEVAEKLTGFKAEEVVGRRCMDGILSHVDETGIALCDHACVMEACMQSGTSQCGTAYLRHKNGHRVPVAIKATPLRSPKGEIEGAIQLFSDGGRLAEIEARMQKLEKLALSDALTGLSNRRCLAAALQRALEGFDQGGSPFFLLYLDIDDFKRVNDTHGHAAGDQVLAAVARTLQTCLRAGDIVARWGGEEFVILACGERSGALRLAEKCLGLIASTTVHSGSSCIAVTASIGIAYVQDGDTPESLLCRADQMLYNSKLRGKNRATDPGLTVTIPQACPPAQLTAR